MTTLKRTLSHERHQLAYLPGRLQGCGTPRTTAVGRFWHVSSLSVYGRLSADSDVNGFHLYISDPIITLLSSLPQAEEGHHGALVGILRAGLASADILQMAAGTVGSIRRLNALVGNRPVPLPAPGSRSRQLPPPDQPAVTQLLGEPGASLVVFPWLRAVVRAARAAPRGAWEDPLSLHELGGFVAAVSMVPGAVCSSPHCIRNSLTRP